MRSLLGIILASTASVLGQTPLETARSHVEKNAVYSDQPPAFDALIEPIEARLKKGRDAETKTMSFVHGIRRHAAKLLSRGQSEQWNQLLASRAEEIKRLHDERNVLRGFFFAKAWELPLATPARRRRVMSDLRAWLRVWLDITMHERIAHHRLCRDAFNLLTPEQRRKLTAGEWDGYVRKSVGHQRAYFGDRIVSKALGKPSHPVRFQKISDQLASDQAKVQAQLLKMEERWRRLSMQIPSVPDPMMVAEWRRTADALGSFFLNQVHNTDVLCRSGYELTDPLVREKIAGQPGRELATLAEKVRTKLTAGAELHQALLRAGEGDTAAKNR